MHIKYDHAKPASLLDNEAVVSTAYNKIRDHMSKFDGLKPKRYRFIRKLDVGYGLNAARKLQRKKVVELYPNQVGELYEEINRAA